MCRNILNNVALRIQSFVFLGPPGKVSFPLPRTSPTSINVHVHVLHSMWWEMVYVCVQLGKIIGILYQKKNVEISLLHTTRLNSSDPSLQVLVIGSPKENTCWKVMRKSIMYKFLSRKERKHHVVQQKKKKLSHWKETEKWEASWRKEKESEKPECV